MTVIKSHLPVLIFVFESSKLPQKMIEIWFKIMVMAIIQE